MLSGALRARSKTSQSRGRALTAREMMSFLNDLFNECSASQGRKSKNALSLKHADTTMRLSVEGAIDNDDDNDSLALCFKALGAKQSLNRKIAEGRSLTRSEECSERGAVKLALTILEGGAIDDERVDDLVNAGREEKKKKRAPAKKGATRDEQIESALNGASDNGATS
jgi:hypothetical protein